MRRRIAILFILPILAFAACTNPKPKPPIKATVQVFGVGEKLNPQHLLDDSLTSAWQMKVEGKHTMIHLKPEQKAYLDTIQLQWIEADTLVQPEVLQIFSSQRPIGSFAPNDFIPINDSVSDLRIVMRFAVDPICIQPESQHSTCLLRRRVHPVAMLSELHGLDWKLDYEERAFSPNKKMPQAQLPFYRGVGKKGRDYGVALHSWGGFSGHAGNAVYFGEWKVLEQGLIALEGNNAISGEVLKDTLEFEWVQDTVSNEPKLAGIHWDKQYLPEHLPDSAFVAIRRLGDFEYDLRYATTNNFMEEAVYPCGDCWLRYEAALALLRAQKTLLDQGYNLLMYDCYRPVSVQKRMWEVYPNPTYVANPYKGVGSIHNRGGAVDLTVIDQQGKPLDMGSTYDYFGVEAHQDNFNLPEQVLANRKIFREAMVKAGYRTIRTEWWHYSYRNKTKFRVADVTIECPED